MDPPKKVWDIGRSVRMCKEGTILRAEVVPNAKVNSWERVDEWRDALRVKIAAEPRQGKANAALLEFIAETFQIPTNRVRLMTGQTSRLKEVVLIDLDYTRARARLLEVLKK